MVKSLLEKTWLIFLASMLLGLFFPQASKLLQPYLIVLLIGMATLSIKDVHISEIFHRHNIKKAILLVGLNYLLLGAVTIISTMLIVVNSHYSAGLIVMASVPAAIA